MSAVTHKPDSNRRAAARVVMFVGCLLAGSFGAAAAAAPTDDVPTLVVRYGDLDLSSQEGNIALYGRIVAAAKRVCPLADGRNLHAFAVSRECQAHAVAEAVHAVGSSRLAAVYAEHSKNHG